MPLDGVSARDALQPVLVDRLAPAQILGVDVREDTDQDGDPVLRVTVTFQAEHDRLDPTRVVSLIRHLRNTLAALGEDRFPLVRFQTAAEAAEGNPEAA